MANIEEIKNNKAFNQNFVLENAYWKFEILKKNDDYIYRLSNKLNSTLYSDVDYYYGCCLKKGDNVNQLVLESRTLACETNEKLFITGKFLNEEIFFEQVFELKKDSIWLEEKIKIINKSSKEITFSNIDFGFLKRLFSQDIGWFDNLDEFCLSSIPTRRFHGQLIDRRLDSFSANDLVNSPWFEDPEATSKPGFCSEGWLWGDNKTNLLVCKYNLEEIEYSRFNRHSIPVDGRGVEDVAVILGGCFLYKGNPENAAEIKAKENYSFGSTKYAVFEGDYSDGFYLYREHLNEKGHIYLKNYNPPLNWNEIYNLGWIGENFNTIPIKNKSKILPYSLEQLYEEAELAKDIGAQCLYLDPGWETYYGSTIWDSDRLGSLSGFSKKVHDEYGLKIGFQQVMCFLSEKELDNFYFLDKEGSKVKYGGGQFIPLFHFCANNFWISEKTKRLLNLLKEGIDFIVFDGTDLPNLGNTKGCFGKNHGHEIPMKKQTHASNILKLIEIIKKEYPDVLIETHDRITGGMTKEGHPLYYQHDPKNNFYEIWGFEFMWNAMQDLISGKAISLYYYNLAYSIPLYLHINENSDNVSMLQFWWYASVIRHLGVGGLRDRSSEKYKALKGAVGLYNRIKKYFSTGKFYGIDSVTHLHINEEIGNGIITVYNLSSKNKKHNIKIDLKRFNLIFKRIIAYNGNGITREDFLIERTKNSITIEINIASLSPAIIELA